MSLILRCPTRYGMLALIVIDLVSCPITGKNQAQIAKPLRT